MSSIKDINKISLAVLITRQHAQGCKAPRCRNREPHNRDWYRNSAVWYHRTWLLHGVFTFLHIHGTVILISKSLWQYNNIFNKRYSWLSDWSRHLYNRLLLNWPPTTMASGCETNSEYGDVTQEDQEKFMKEALLMVLESSLIFDFVSWTNTSNLGRESFGSWWNSSRMCPCTTRQNNRIRDEWYKSVYECMFDTTWNIFMYKCLIKGDPIGHKTCRIPRNRGSTSDIP